MTSIIRSDNSLSFNGRGASVASVADRLTDAKQVTQLSAIIGNGARDSALQINGHVTDKINNLNFKYLIIPCNCEIVRAVASTRLASLPSAAAPGKPRLLAPVNRSTHYNIVGSAEISSLLKEKQKVRVLSKATGQPQTFFIILPRRVKDNFISLQIVKRLGLGMHFDTAAVSSITWNSKRILSTGHFVNLFFSMPGSSKSIARRFHVVKDCSFDMLLGTAATDPSLN